MKSLVSVLLLAVASLVAGCAGTAASVKTEYRLAQGERLSLQVTAPPTITDEGLQILKAKLTAQLTEASLLADASATSGRILDVTVTNYTMRHGAARALLGIMAGSDNIQSTVKVKDRVTGAVLSEFSVESKNPTAMGTSRGMIETHADTIVETLRGGKKS